MSQISTQTTGTPIVFREHEADHHRGSWESAMLAQALLDNTDVEPRQKKRLMTIWLLGLFNGAASHTAERGGIGRGGTFEWTPTGPEHDKLAWHAPYGVTMLLAQVYGQENGSFAAVVVAGIKDDIHRAMGAAEWAIARLSSGEGDGSACSAPVRPPAPDRGVVSVTRRRSRSGLGWRRYLFMAGPANRTVGT